MRSERAENIEAAPLGEPTASRYRVVIVFMLGLATLVNFLILFNLGVLLPSISEDLDLSPSEQGWLGSSAILANLAFSLPLGWLVSRLNAKLVTTVTLVAAAFFLFVQGWAPVFAVLLVGRVLFGIAGVAREPARAMLTQQWIPSREIVLMNGLLNGTIGVAIAIGFFLTPFMLLWFDDDWRIALYIYAVATLVVAVAWHLLGKERITPSYRQQARSQKGTPLGSLFRYRELWAMGVGLAGANLLWMAFITFWPTQMLDDYDVSLVSSGALMAVSGLVSAVFGLIFSLAMMKRDIGRWVLMLCGVLITSTSAGMVMTGSLPLLVLMSLFNGVGWSFFPIMMTLPFKLPGIKPREIAVAVAFYEMAIWAGGAVGPALAGILQEATDDLRLTLVVLSFFGLCLTLGAVFLPTMGWREIAPELAPTGELAPVSDGHDLPGPATR
ncbi:MAG: MFS transporter [Dehalococcoidia bacterium]